MQNVLWFVCDNRKDLDLLIEKFKSSEALARGYPFKTILRALFSVDRAFGLTFERAEKGAHIFSKRKTSVEESIREGLYPGPILHSVRDWDRIMHAVELRDATVAKTPLYFDSFVTITPK